jgi:hypothetical protein
MVRFDIDISSRSEERRPDMVTTARSTPDELEAAAGAIAERYPAAPPRETDIAVALLALWTLDALDAGRLSEDDASMIWTHLWVGITDRRDGPDLADPTDELLLEGGWFHDEAIGAAPDRGQLRTLARQILGAS